MYINCLQNRVSRSVKTVHTNILANYVFLHKFATTNNIFFKSITSDMHQCITYMYINFLQNRVSDTVTLKKWSSLDLT